jgi:hypothetical protein
MAAGGSLEAPLGALSTSSGWNGRWLPVPMGEDERSGCEPADLRESGRLEVEGGPES